MADTKVNVDGGGCGCCGCLLFLMAVPFATALAVWTLRFMDVI